MCGTSIRFPADRGREAYLARLRSEAAALRFASLHIEHEMQRGGLTQEEAASRMSAIFRDLGIIAGQIANILSAQDPISPFHEPVNEDDERDESDSGR